MVFTHPEVLIDAKKNIAAPAVGAFSLLNHGEECEWAEKPADFFAEQSEINAEDVIEHRKIPLSMWIKLEEKNGVAFLRVRMGKLQKLYYPEPLLMRV